jgi:hypothetical protein
MGPVGSIPAPPFALPEVGADTVVSLEGVGQCSHAHLELQTALPLLLREGGGETNALDPLKWMTVGNLCLLKRAISGSDADRCSD